MSWDAWAQQVLQDDKGNKTNSGGLLCDTEGNVWGACGTLNNTMRFSQLAAMCKAVYPGGPAAQGSFNFPDEGCAGSEKYMVLRSDDICIIAKKGSAGLTIAKYKNQGYIVGCYSEGIQPGVSNSRVLEVAEKLSPSNSA